MSAFCVPIFRVSLYIWILETVSPIVHPERHNRFGTSKKHFPFIRAFRWKDRFLLYVIKRHFTWYQHKGSVLSWQLLPTSVFKLNFCLHNKPRFSFLSFYLIFPRMHLLFTEDYTSSRVSMRSLLVVEEGSHV